jgi:TatD DNase family protein
MHPPLIDIGINLTHDSFEPDRAAVLQRARDAGLVHLVITGASLAGAEQAVALAETDPSFLCATAGVHPHHASELTRESLPRLAATLAHPSVRAAGECGLDYFRDYSPRSDQRQAFEWQLELAIERQLPVFLHQRDAHADFVAVLKAAGPLPPCVAHCFTGSVQEAEEYLAMGLHIGITGWICDERRGQHLEEVVRRIPADRLMIETDGPYLLPRTLQPKPASRRNEPAFLPEVARVIAAARGESLEALAASSTQTAARFFGLSLPSNVLESTAHNPRN